MLNGHYCVKAVIFSMTHLPTKANAYGRHLMCSRPSVDGAPEGRKKTMSMEDYLSLTRGSLAFCYLRFVSLYVGIGDWTQKGEDLLTPPPQVGTRPPCRTDEPLFAYELADPWRCPECFERSQLKTERIPSETLKIREPSQREQAACQGIGTKIGQLNICCIQRHFSFVSYTDLNKQPFKMNVFFEINQANQQIKDYPVNPSSLRTSITYQKMAITDGQSSTIFTHSSVGKVLELRTT